MPKADGTSRAEGVSPEPSLMVCGGGKPERHSTGRWPLSPAWLLRPSLPAERQGLPAAVSPRTRRIHVGLRGEPADATGARAHCHKNGSFLRFSLGGRTHRGRSGGHPGGGRWRTVSATEAHAGTLTGRDVRGGDPAPREGLPEALPFSEIDGVLPRCQLILILVKRQTTSLTCIPICVFQELAHKCRSH